MGTNKIIRMRDLVKQIKEANTAYFREDNPVLSDREFDALMEELRSLEKETGISFSDSPSRIVGGENLQELTKVTHTKPMLSANKTKSMDELAEFVCGEDVIVSWKMDGLTLVVRYEDGEFKQAITRGEHGLVGEDITHSVRHIRNLPLKVSCKDKFEVRGEGVISWDDFNFITRHEGKSHPRNVAAGLVRTKLPDRGRIGHMDFFAFEYIGDEEFETKDEQLDYLTEQGFEVVEHRLVDESEDFRAIIAEFNPEEYPYPVDGVMVEYDNIEYGMLKGSTDHHENRMMALKWADDLHETIFRGMDCSTTKNGVITFTAEFDPVTIDGTIVKRADLHSLANVEKLKLGVGDTIRVYKANMIVPQVADNLTMSGTYELPKVCPCCGSPLKIVVGQRGARNLCCENKDCIAQNAQKIARFCDKDAMDISGLSIATIENLMADRIITDIASLYKLRNRQSLKGVGAKQAGIIIDSIYKSRKCHLYQFLNGIGIQLMNHKAAQSIDEYFEGSWNDFEAAIKKHFRFDHIDGISRTLSSNIYYWYNMEKDQWRDVLAELTFIRDAKEVGDSNSPFTNANIAITGKISKLDRETLGELLTVMGAYVDDRINPNTNYLLVGDNPNGEMIVQAIANKVELLVENTFMEMLGCHNVS